MLYGAILGDIIGSPYEFNDNMKTKEFPLFGAKSAFTDDTVMTVAVAAAVRMSHENDDLDQFRSRAIKMMKLMGEEYPNYGYGLRFNRWLCSDDSKPYNSCGNGSAMRVSAVGWAFDSLEKTRQYARASADVTHNHPEGIKGAEAIACAIYLARNGSSKAEIKSYVESEFGYNLDRTLAEIRPTFKMDETCQGTVPEALIAFLEADSFEDTVRNAVSLGGDADTTAAIAGSVAEAFYGIDDELIRECRGRLTRGLVEEIDEFERMVKGK